MIAIPRLQSVTTWENDFVILFSGFINSGGLASDPLNRFRFTDELSWELVPLILLVTEKN